MNQLDCNEIRKSLDDACHWLLSQIDEDGCVGESDSISVYSKVPASLLACGQVPAACRVLSWIDRVAMDAQRRLILSPQFEVDYPFSTYERAWVVRGALLGDRYDLVIELINQIAEYQDANTGGFWDTAAEKEGVKGQQSCMTAGMAGMALIACNQMEAAIKAGEFLLDTFEDQPQRTEGFFAVRDVGGCDQAGPFLEKNSMSYVDFYGTAQRPGRFGPVMVFLVRLYRITRQVRFLDLAKKYANLFLDTEDKAFLCIECHKFLWGLAELYQVSPDDRYLEKIGKGLTFLLEFQQPGGYWVPTSQGVDHAEVTMQVAVSTNVLVGLTSYINLLGDVHSPSS